MSDRIAWATQGRRLEYFTIAWNSLEGLVAVGSGLLAGSVSLVGFGLDSFIEVTSGITLLWRMAGESDACQRARREAAALRVVGVCFLALAAYVAYESLRQLVEHAPTLASPVGIGLACVSIVVMPVLSRAKRRIARGLGSGAMHADARQTDFCMYLSAILLVGLVLNALFGLWWVDPLAGLAMTPIIAREGIASVRGETCCE
jgi:divalent metal cation (Fe/Co/Zn/Cd) transporter